MLSTESWDNCEKPPLLFPFTALTCDETPVFSGSVLNFVAHSVDKYGIG
ncbi:protein YgdT [Escherichia coli]